MKKKVTNTKKASTKLIKKAAFITTFLAGLISIGIVKSKHDANSEVKSSSVVESTVTPTAVPTVAVTSIPTPTIGIDDLLEESRYTEITEDNLVKASQELVEELKKNGIEVTGEEVLTFVSVANITHLKETNPELAKKVFGETPDAEATLTKVGHIIGKIVSLQMNDAITVDYTKAFIDPIDKKIGKYNIELINKLDKVLTDNDIKNEEKTEKFSKMVQENFIDMEFNVNKEYVFSDGTSTKLVQEDGADFITDGITTGMLSYGKNIKNYIKDGSEMNQDIDAIAANMDVVSDLQVMIEDCGQLDNETAKVKTK